MADACDNVSLSGVCVIFMSSNWAVLFKYLVPIAIFAEVRIRYGFVMHTPLLSRLTVATLPSRPTFTVCHAPPSLRKKSFMYAALPIWVPIL